MADDWDQFKRTSDGDWDKIVESLIALIGSLGEL